MKKATIIAIVATITSIMFAGVNLTWGNTYESSDDGVVANPSFGVWFDVNDQTSIGWENGVKVSLAGPGSSDFRLGYDGGTSLGVNWNWWESTGTGWGTSLGTSLDFGLTDYAASCSDGTSVDLAACTLASESWDTGGDQGAWSITINLGFGF